MFLLFSVSNLLLLIHLVVESLLKFNRNTFIKIEDFQFEN